MPQPSPRLGEGHDVLTQCWQGSADDPPHPKWREKMKKRNEKKLLKIENIIKKFQVNARSAMLVPINQNWPDRLDCHKYKIFRTELAKKIFMTKLTQLQ